MTGNVPEIEEIWKQETLHAYLRNRPVIEAEVLAFRSALRVMPLVTRFVAVDFEQIQKLLLSVFRASFFSSAALNLPDYKDKFSKSAGFAAYDTYEIAAGLSSSFDEDAKYAGDLAAVTTAAYATAYATAHVADAASVVSSYSDATADAAHAADYVRSSDYIWWGIQDDLSYMHEVSGVDCLGLPLWRLGAEPQPVLEWEAEFCSQLEKFGPDWRVVYAFYQDLRNGYSPFARLGSEAEEVLLTLAEEERDFWERHPDEVMRDLVERLGHKAEYTVSHGEIDGVQENLTQVAADFRFAENEQGAIDALPFSALARDPGFAGTTLFEAREKTQELADRLKRANAPGRVMRSVTRLLEALPEELGDLNPALLRSRSRSLEADAIAYGAAGAEAELFPDAVSELLDVVGTLNDLQGCFPAIAEVERNIAAIDIAGREDKVQPELSVISASARELSAQYPHVMTEAAAEAVAALDADIADAADIEVKRDLLARSLLIKRNFLSAVYRKVLSPAGREALRVGKLHYDGAISGSVEGVKKLAGSAPAAFLAFYFTGPLGVLIILLAGQFKSLKDAKDVVDRLKSDGQRSENDQD